MNLNANEFGFIEVPNELSFYECAPNGFCGRKRPYFGHERLYITVNIESYKYRVNKLQTFCYSIKYIKYLRFDHFK